MVGKRKVVGGYELGRALGEGTFAKVRFAREVATGRGVAIKVIDKKKVIEEAMMDALTREILTMKAARHPCVVNLQRVMATQHKIYIVLQLVTGGELFDLVCAKGRLSEDVSRQHFHRLIDGVAYCHSKGVYHRDLKPENLLLNDNGEILISDFGLSALSQGSAEGSMLQTACGTPNYVAPEVIADDSDGYSGAPADIWSCGVILYLLASGTLPFDDVSTPRLFQKIKHAKYVRPSFFSPSLTALVEKMLQPDPTKRATIQDIQQDAWFSVNYVPIPTPSEDTQVVTGSAEEFGAEVVEELELQGSTSGREQRNRSLNAFEIINMTAFDLNELFEKREDVVLRHTRFMCWDDTSTINKSVSAAAKQLGFRPSDVEDGLKLEGADKSGLPLSGIVELFEVIPGLHMVEFRRLRGNRLSWFGFYSDVAGVARKKLRTAGPGT